MIQHERDLKPWKSFFLSPGFYLSNYEKWVTVCNNSGLLGHKHTVWLYQCLTQMANKIGSHLDFLTANYLASGKEKCTFRMESSTRHSQKMLSYQYHLAQKRYYFAVLSHTVHKHEVNQHISTSLWFSRVSLFFPFKVKIWQRHDLIFCYGAFNDFSAMPQLSERAKI